MPRPNCSHPRTRPQAQAACATCFLTKIGVAKPPGVASTSVEILAGSTSLYIQHRREGRWHRQLLPVRVFPDNSRHHSLYQLFLFPHQPPMSARPRPVFRPMHQPALHRVFRYIAPDPANFGYAPAPVVERFILPKRKTGSTQNSVRAPGRHALQHFHEHPRLVMRKNQQMHVVRHHDILQQRVTPEAFVGSFDFLRNDGRDSRIFHPSWPRRRAVEHLIESFEFLTG